MGVETAPGLDAIVVDHQQVGKANLFRIVVAAKGKAVA
jgi:hypothetical protein